MEDDMERGGVRDTERDRDKVPGMDMAMAGTITAATAGTRA